MINGYPVNTLAINRPLTGVSRYIESSVSVVIDQTADYYRGLHIDSDNTAVFLADAEIRRGVEIFDTFTVAEFFTEGLFGLQARVESDMQIPFSLTTIEDARQAKTMYPYRFFIEGFMSHDIEYQDYRYTGGEATISVSAISNLHGIPGDTTDGEPAAKFFVPPEVRGWKVQAKSRETGGTECLA